MIRAFEEKGFRIECKSESFESWSDNHSEHTLYIKILQKNSFRHNFKDLTKVCSNLHSQPYLECTQSEEPPFSTCLRS